VEGVVGLVSRDCAHDVSVGWPPALIELYEVERLRLSGLAALLTGDAEVGAELVQDAFVSAAGRGDTVENHKAYVTRAVVNACRSHSRRVVTWARKWPLIVASSSLVSTAPDDYLLDAIESLPTRQRQAVILRFYGGLATARSRRCSGRGPGR